MTTAEEPAPLHLTIEQVIKLNNFLRKNSNEKLGIRQLSFTNVAGRWFAVIRLTGNIDGYGTLQKIKIYSMDSDRQTSEENGFRTVRIDRRESSHDFGVYSNRAVFSSREAGVVRIYNLSAEGDLGEPLIFNAGAYFGYIPSDYLRIRTSFLVSKESPYSDPSIFLHADSHNLDRYQNKSSSALLSVGKRGRLTVRDMKWTSPERLGMQRLESPVGQSPVFFDTYQVSQALDNLAFTDYPIPFKSIPTYPFSELDPDLVERMKQNDGRKLLAVRRFGNVVVHAELAVDDENPRGVPTGYVRASLLLPPESAGE